MHENSPYTPAMMMQTLHAIIQLHSRDIQLYPVRPATYMVYLQVECKWEGDSVFKLLYICVVV